MFGVGVVGGGFCGGGLALVDEGFDEDVVVVVDDGVEFVSKATD